MDALLAGPDRGTSQGRRDYALLLFLYNSGARANEAAQLLVRDVDLQGLSVRIIGKGRKQRLCPLWPTTVDQLMQLIAGSAPLDHVFLNRCGQPITRFGIHTLVERSALRASHASAIAGDQASQSAHRSTLHRDGTASSRCRYQHDPRLAWPRLT